MALQTSDLVEIWKRTIETQMHFNEMSTKSRQLGLTLVVAALGLSAVLLGRGDDFSLLINVCNSSIKLHAVVLILLASALGLYGVMQLDLGVYHQMLRGAVKFGEEFERENLVADLKTGLGLTEFVSLYSRHSSVQKVDGQYQGANQKLAGDKLKRFYWVSIVTICALAISIFVVTQHGLVIERPATKNTQPATK